MTETYRPQPKSQLVLPKWVSPPGFFHEQKVDPFARHQMYWGQRELAAV